MKQVLSLFAGIGGFDLGLERTGGFKTVAFCEIDPFCQRVLAKHWPEVPCYDDVRTLTADRLAADGIAVDVIVGGFPCQDISEAHVHGRGLDGERSGLWFEFERLIGEIRPRFVIVENVAALLNRGLDRVLGALAEIGLDAEWHCIPAAAVGAPHERDRIWIIAYASAGERRPLIGACDRVAWADAIPQWQEGAGRSEGLLEAAWGADAVMVADALSRMDDGVRVRMDGFNACANAVVPQIPEMIGRAILAAEADAVSSEKERAA